MEFEYWILRPDVHLSPSIALYNEQGIVVFTSGPAFDPEGSERSHPAGLYRHTCRVPGDLLNDGMYQAALYIGSNGRTVLQQDNILVFDVRDAIEMRHGWHGKWNGVVRPMLDWSTEFVEAEPSPASRPESRRHWEVPQ
jgi:lipopolysaccharide transport system ATP-binding protein